MFYVFYLHLEIHDGLQIRNTVEQIYSKNNFTDFILKTLYIQKLYPE